MSTETTTTETTQPTTTATPPVPPVVKASDLPEDALKARIEQAKRSERAALLAELGVTDPEQAKAAIATAKAAAEAQKTDAEKLASASLKVTQYEAALDLAIKQNVARITPEQKAAVDAIAGDDKATWLRTLEALVPTWAVSKAEIAPAPVSPANTAPSSSGAPPSATTSPVDHAATWRGLQQTNPMIAAAYLLTHGAACYPSK